MTRLLRGLAVAAVGSATVAVARQRDAWRRDVWQVASDEDARRLLHLHADGLLTSAEARRVAHWTQAYEPGAVVESLSRLLLEDSASGDRAADKAAWFTRLGSEIGPHLPTVRRSSLTSAALATPTPDLDWSRPKVDA